MNILSINKPLKVNSLSIECLVQHNVFVFVQADEAGDLADAIRAHAAAIVVYQHTDEVLALVKTILSPEIESRVFCVSEDHMMLAAEVRKYYHLSGLSTELTGKFRDKVRMKQVLQSAGIRVPDFGRFDASLSFEALSARLGLPFVLKPVDALGAFGVYIVQDKAGYQQAVGHTGASSYEYEEYITGKLYHVDTLMQNGEVVFQAACEYTAPNLDFQKGVPIMSVPLYAADPLAQQLKDFTVQCLAGLGLESGPSHTEVFVLDHGELVFLESAARTPGAVVVPLYHEQFGFNMIEAAFQIEVGELFTLPEVSQPFYVFSGLFPMAEGVLKAKLPLPIDSDYDITWKVQEGDTMPAATSLRNISASVMAKNTNYQHLLADFKKLMAFQPFELADAIE